VLSGDGIDRDGTQQRRAALRRGRFARGTA
jgi:hypothetical protein